ncbi:MAG: hypothetical protein KDC18_11375 [Alphaproteobacteria bacterium]|nr:hypothetical protein [Alphaproteobacteria bacterium]MCB9946204.1 hypothetical protein [Rhodospirillaceae bacterium]
MPEELIGFGFFQSAREPYIANDMAVLEASDHLFNLTAFDAAADHLDRAGEAVLAAARANDIRGADDGNGLDQPPYADGSDFFL